MDNNDIDYKERFQDLLRAFQQKLSREEWQLLDNTYHRVYDIGEGVLSNDEWKAEYQVIVRVAKELNIYEKAYNNTQNININEKH